MPTYRRAARPETPSLMASRSAVMPGLAWISSRASSARAVGLASGFTLFTNPEAERPECSLALGHGYRTLPEPGHRLSRPRRSRDVLRHDAGLEDHHLAQLGRDSRGLRRLHLLPAGRGLHPAAMAGAAGAPADPSRRQR